MFGLSLGFKSLTSDVGSSSITELKAIDNQVFSDLNNSFSLDSIEFADSYSELPSLEFDSLSIMEDLIQQAENGNLLPLLSFIADLPTEQFEQIQSSFTTQLSNRTDLAKALNQLNSFLSQSVQNSQMKNDMPTVTVTETEQAILVKDFLPKNLESLTARIDQLFQQTNTVKPVMLDKLSNVNIETNHHLVSPPNLAQQSTSNIQVQTTRLITPLENASWSNQFAERVTMLVGQQQHAARIKINPPELGPIEVKINIQNEQANVHVLAQHQAVRESLEDSMPRLRELLQQQGIALGDFNVTSDGSDQQLAKNANEELEWTFIEEENANKQVQETAMHEDLLVNAYV